MNSQELFTQVPSGKHKNSDGIAHEFSKAQIRQPNKNFSNAIYYAQMRQRGKESLIGGVT
jgi:hypothetical protein